MNLKQYWQKHPIPTAWSLALAFLIFRAIYVNFIQLAPDEAYYWEWSRHLALSYYDQGPVLGLAIRLGTWLFGSTEFGVRFATLACGFGLSSLAIWFCSSWFKRPIVAPYAVLALNTMLLYAAGGVLMVHDPLQIFFWAAALACLGLGIRDKSLLFWALAGVLGGAGMASKYTGILFVPCLFLALATHPKLKPWLKRPHPYVATLLGALAGIPIVIWNVQNNWPSFQHVFSLAGADTSRSSPTTFPEFLTSQIGLATPFYLFFILRAWWHLAGDWRRGKADSRAWLLACLSAPFFIFFLLLSFKTRVEGNWPATAYFGGTLLALLDLEKSKSLKSKPVRWGFALALVMTLLVHLQAVRPFIPFPQSLAKADSPSRLDGWKDMAKSVDDERAKLGPDTFVGTATYQNAAELGFYCHYQPPVLIIIAGFINHQYRFWNQPGTYRGLDAVMVTQKQGEVDELAPRFERLEKAGDYSFSRNGVVVRQWQVYRGYGFKG